MREISMCIQNSVLLKYRGIECTTSWGLPNPELLAVVKGLVLCHTFF